MNEQHLDELASGLHKASIRLLRTLRREDRASGISAPRLSALSVLVFAGPLSLADLADAEGVKPPTMSRIVEKLVRDDLATREADPANRRMVRIAATEAGRALLEAGRARRLAALATMLRPLAESELRALGRGIEILERITR